MLAVTRLESNKGAKYRVELKDAQGNATGRECTKTYESVRHYDEAARLLGVDVQSIIDAVSAERAKPVETVAESKPDKPFAVRPVQSSRRTFFNTFSDALKSTPDVESVIEWEDITQCCAVDFDWHGVDAPSDVLNTVYQMKPRPAYAWATRSGGLRLIYVGPDADAIAACAVVSIYTRLLGFTGVELLKHTRFPAIEPEGSGHSGTLSDISAQFADEVDKCRVEEWLEENGYSFGQRYPHDRCPIDSGHVSNAPDPVVVTEHGIYCHSCTGRAGRGFRSFAYLLGVQVDSVLARMVKGFVHWDHAKLSLADLHPLPDTVLRSYYRGCLLGKHGTDDPRVDAVFMPHGIVRGSGVWYSLTGEPRNPERLKATVAGLPATQNKDGKFIAPIAEEFLDNVSLDVRGYESVRLVHGMRIGTQWDSPDKRPRLVVPVPGNMPQYLDAKTRQDEALAWEAVEVAYPGIDRNLITLLVVARGHVERGSVSMPPMIFLDGVTSSGKSSHMQIAAAFCGDRCTDLIPTVNDDEMGKRLWEAFQKGSFITVNEATKGARKAKVDPTAFMNFILHISPTVTYRVLYRGYALLGGSPILAITDTEFDDAVMSDGQLGRRAFYRNLGTEARNWKASTAAYGLSQWSDIRGEIADLTGLRRAVDSLVSIWIDRYFGDETPTLDEVAESLGVTYMNKSGPAAERLDLMRQLFESWMSYKGPNGTANRNKQRKGFKAFKPLDVESNGLAAVWARLHDEGDPFQWSRANELSWQGATGRDNPLRIEFRPVQRDRRDYLQMRFQELREGAWADLTG